MNKKFDDCSEQHIRYGFHMIAMEIACVTLHLLIIVSLETKQGMSVKSKKTKMNYKIDS